MFCVRVNLILLEYYFNVETVDFFEDSLNIVQVDLWYEFLNVSVDDFLHILDNIHTEMCVDKVFNFVVF